MQVDPILSHPNADALVTFKAQTHEQSMTDRDRPRQGTCIPVHPRCIAK